MNRSRFSLAIALLGVAVFVVLVRIDVRDDGDPEPVMVPDVIHLRPDEARTVLDAAGLVPVIACTSSGEADEPGKVYRTEPGPGAMACSGDPVIVYAESPCRL
jgi:beta-lactam-binding protein with PASTA domain